MSVLFLSKADDTFSKIAGDFIRLSFPDAIVVFGKRGEPLPSVCELWNGNWVISYICPWIVPEWLLKRARKGAINFHPGPPEYPGIGCTNFALYNNEKIYGVTAHHMAVKVDTGSIIAVRRFPVFPTDTVYSLTQRCYAHTLMLFFEILSNLLSGEHLPVSEETWRRKPYRREELNALCEIKPEMSEDEIRRRVKATTFPNMPGAYVVLGGHKFVLDTKEG